MKLWVRHADRVILEPLCLSLIQRLIATVPDHRLNTDNSGQTTHSYLRAQLRQCVRGTHGCTLQSSFESYYAYTSWSLQMTSSTSPCITIREQDRYTSACLVRQQRATRRLLFTRRVGMPATIVVKRPRFEDKVLSRYSRLVNEPTLGQCVGHCHLEVPQLTLANYAHKYSGVSSPNYSPSRALFLFRRALF